MAESFTKYKEQLRARGWLGTYDEFKNLLKALDETVREERIDSIRQNSHQDISREAALQLIYEEPFGGSESHDQTSHIPAMVQLEADFLVPSVGTKTKNKLHRVSGALDDIADEIIHQGFTEFYIMIPLSAKGTNNIEIRVDPQLGIGAYITHEDEHRALFLKGVFAQLLKASTTRVEKVVTHNGLTAGLLTLCVYIILLVTDFPYGFSVNPTSRMLIVGILSVALGVSLCTPLRKLAPAFTIVDQPSHLWYRRWPARLLGLLPPALISVGLAELLSYG